MKKKNTYVHGWMSIKYAYNFEMYGKIIIKKSCGSESFESPEIRFWLMTDFSFYLDVFVFLITVVNTNNTYNFWNFQIKIHKFFL